MECTALAKVGIIANPRQCSPFIPPQHQVGLFPCETRSSLSTLSTTNDPGYSTTEQLILNARYLGMPQVWPPVCLIGVIGSQPIDWLLKVRVVEIHQAVF